MLIKKINVAEGRWAFLAHVFKKLKVGAKSCILFPEFLFVTARLHITLSLEDKEKSSNAEE